MILRCCMFIHILLRTAFFFFFFGFLLSNTSSNSCCNRSYKSDLDYNDVPYACCSAADAVRLMQCDVAEAAQIRPFTQRCGHIPTTTRVLQPDRHSRADTGGYRSFPPPREYSGQVSHISCAEDVGTCRHRDPQSRMAFYTLDRLSDLWRSAYRQTH